MNHIQRLIRWTYTKCTSCVKTRFPSACTFERIWTMSSIGFLNSDWRMLRTTVSLLVPIYEVFILKFEVLILKILNLKKIKNKINFFECFFNKNIQIIFLFFEVYFRKRNFVSVNVLPKKNEKLYFIHKRFQYR